MAEWSPRVKRIGVDQPERLVFAYALVRERKFKEAQHEIEAILKKDGKSFAANIGLGFVLQLQGQFAQSVEAFDRARALDPMQPIGPLLAGFSYLIMRKHDEAVSAFKATLDLDPRMAVAHLGLARTMNQKGDTQEAIGEVEEALRLDPQMVPARLMLAQLYNAGGDTENAAAELESVLAVEPGQRAASVSLAMMCNKRGDPQKATSILETFLKTKPDDAPAWMALAQIRAGENDLAGTESALRENLRVKPANVFAKLQLVDALIQQGKLDEATQMLESMPRRGVLQRAVHKCYGDLYVAQNRKDLAAQSYRAALLNVRGGDEIVAGIEKRIGNGAADVNVAITEYQAGLERLKEDTKEWLGDQDWRGVLERMGPNLLKMIQTVRRGQTAAREAS